MASPAIVVPSVNLSRVANPCYRYKSQAQEFDVWLLSPPKIVSFTTILIKCQEFARLNYVMGTKTSNRSWKSADVCTFLPLGFFNSLEAMQSCFGAHVEIVVRDGQTI